MCNPFVFLILGLEAGSSLPSIEELFPSLERGNLVSTLHGFSRMELITPIKTKIPVTLTAYDFQLSSPKIKGTVVAFLDQMSSVQIQALFEEVSTLTYELETERVSFKNLLNRLQSGIIWGNKENIWYANSRTRDFVAESLLREGGISDLFEDREKILHYLERRVNISNLEMRLVTQGRSLPCMVNISCLPRGNEEGWLIEILDIEEKKKLEDSIMDMTQIFIQERNELRKNQETLSLELRLAREIQFSLLPHKEFSTIAYLYQPMEEIGGDFLDLVEIDPDNVGIFISDVCGHGIAASLITVMLKQNMTELKPFARNPAHFLSRLNGNLFHQLRGYFLTAIYALYNQKEKKLTIANAGHPYPFLYRQGHFATLATIRSQPIGTFPSMEYQQQTICLQPGERVLFYTDGLLDTSNPEGESYEEKNLAHFLQTHRDFQAYDLMQNLLEDLREFHGERHLEDDIAFICLDVS
ncbi:PP2C family protein-serine/threonine phosphatase [Thermospira aquatica]|uniref:Serine/threonine-protein phosphatase n=1 Tax=Thermospira aquatica TaxID=2828656 RepID=A0AAX3BIY7_9SPIR|nr:PP2C family protein-serine/threonine phosphatase [Thermospira aquatica]URA11281.1 serine/threonine-protein phosphatase [Thermospira aquatica]